MRGVLSLLFVCVALQIAQAALTTPALPTGVVFNNGFVNGWGLAEVGGSAVAGVEATGAQQVIVGTFAFAGASVTGAADAATNATAAARAYAQAAANAVTKFAAAASATADVTAAASAAVLLAAAGDAQAAASAYAAAAVDIVQKSIVAQAAAAEARVAAQAAADAGAQLQGFINLIIAIAPGASQVYAPLVLYAGGLLTPGNTYNLAAVVTSGVALAGAVDLTGYADTTLSLAQAALAATISQPTSVFVTAATAVTTSAQIATQAATTAVAAANNAASSAAAATLYAQSVYIKVQSTIYSAFSFAVKTATPFTNAVFTYYSFAISSPQTGVIAFSVNGGTPQTVNVSPAVQVVTAPLANFQSLTNTLASVTFFSIGANPTSVNINNIRFY